MDNRILIKSAYYNTRGQLPETLEVGCKYFIKDEGIVLINHGDGNIVAYGSSTFKDVPTDGELYGIRGEVWEKIPETEIQEQLDQLSEASIINSAGIAEIKQTLRDIKKSLEELTEKMANN